MAFTEIADSGSWTEWDRNSLETPPELRRYLAIFGALLLIVYGVIATLQPTTFGRTYAAYGGVFVILSLLWGWWIDKLRPDIPDVAGALICLLGVSIIMYWPRA